MALSNVPPVMIVFESPMSLSCDDRFDHHSVCSTPRNMQCVLSALALRRNRYHAKSAIANEVLSAPKLEC
jgi:hypothetical protein